MEAAARFAWQFHQAECVRVLIINFWMKTEQLAHLVLEKCRLACVKLENSAAEMDTVSHLGGSVTGTMTAWMGVTRTRPPASIIAALMISLNARIIAASPRNGFVMELMIVGAMKTNPIRLVQPEHARLTSFLVEMAVAFPELGCVTERMTAVTRQMKWQLVNSQLVSH